MSWRARLSPAIQNFTVFVNSKDPHCFGVRNFMRLNFAELNLLNPRISIVLQELSYGEPIMMVQYSQHDIRIIKLAGATEDEMEEIFEAMVNYGCNHAVPIMPNAEGGKGFLRGFDDTINFAFAESFITKLDSRPSPDMGHSTSIGVDDPGQKPRVATRNTGNKLMY